MHIGWANVGISRWPNVVLANCPYVGPTATRRRWANVQPTESSTTLGQRLTNVVMLFLFILCVNCIYLLLYRCPSVPVVPLNLTIHFKCRFNCGLPRCKRCISADKSELCCQAVSEYTAWLSNYIPQYSVGCNYLAIHTCLWHQSPQIS